MSRILASVLTAALIATSAHAAPGGVMRSMTVSSDGASAEAVEKKKPGLVATVFDYFADRKVVKAISVGAPEPGATQPVAKEECDQSKTTMAQKEEDREEKLAKQAGPEPIYLAF